MVSLLLFSCANNTIAQQIKIGSQTWATKNLDVSSFRNGDAIPEAKTTSEWTAAGDADKPAWCYYNNDTANGAKYGKLYNWHAVNDARGLAPKGWHVPTDVEWTTLETYLGGSSVAGGKMKVTGTTTWRTPNTAAANSSGFTGLPGGYRDYNGPFYSVAYYGYWWSSTEYITTVAWSRYLYYNNGYFYRNFNNKHYGLSVRGLRD